MMNMKKMVLLLLLLAACAPTTTDPQPTDFRFGTEGLRMTFVQNLPPPRVFESEPLNVMIEVENRGTSMLGGASDRVYLSGFDPTIITGIPTTGVPLPRLEGRDQFSPQGAVDAVNFKGSIVSLSGRRVDKYPVTLLATSCYQYETVATGQICVDPDPYTSATVQKVCIPSSISLGSQGAPVAISSVDVEPAPGRTRFKINIGNVGGGDVFKAGAQYAEKCNPNAPARLAFNEIDFINVADVMVSGTSIKQSCKPLDASGNVRLTNGVASLYCELGNLRSPSAYVTPLNVILRYGYRQTISRNVDIRAVS